MLKIMAVAAGVLAGAAPQQHAGAEPATTSRAATPAPAPPDSLVFQGDAGDLRVRPPGLSSPDVTIDGRLDEEAWERAAALTGFTQYEPSEGIPASQPTDVRVFYTGDAIYFGIIAHDSAPQAVRATIAERDRSIRSDDWVKVLLDTYDRERQAYAFYVNPYGIQTDGLWIEGFRGQRGGGRQPVDFNPDFIWESRGRITEGGWIAEIRIPYVSLQFPVRSEQTWGIHVTREVRRTGYKQTWAPIRQDAASVLAQQGHLTGLRNLEPRTLVEVNPVSTAKLSGSRVDGRFVRGAVEPEFGFNARWGVTRNMSLGATYNPDFSQVEADQARVTVNERFALFFPEKRPFFLQGTEVFQSPTRLVHTRQIVDPVAGWKLTGEAGEFEMGYLGAVDEAPVTLGDGEHRAAYNLLRVRRTWGQGSSAGALYTGRFNLGTSGYNRVAAADARLVSGSYTFTGQVAGSWTGGEGADVQGFAPLLSLGVEKSGRRWSWQAELTDVADDFRSESGFIRRHGDAELSTRTSLDFYTEPGSLLQRYGAEVQGRGFFTHDGLWSLRSPYEWQMELQGELSFRGGRFLALQVSNSYLAFQEEDYQDYAVAAGGGATDPYRVPGALTGMVGTGLFGFFRISEAVDLNGRVAYRETPIHAEGSLGREFLARPSLGLRPTDRISLDLSYAHSVLWRAEDGSHFSTADATRAELQFQYSRDLFFRAIGQWSLTERDALRDPRTGRRLWIGGEPADATDRGTFGSQLLISYEPSPGTIFYVGWSREMEGPSTYSLGPMHATDGAFFAKLSYLFRL